METVKLGLIGLGNIGKHHAGYLRNGVVKGCELVAVSTTRPAILDSDKTLEIFSSGEEMIKSRKVDALIIATPHFQHTSLGIQAMEEGLHIMVEKPISAHKADAEKLIECHKAHPELVFAGMFQLRAEPRYKKIKHLIDSGEIGEIVRVNWTITDWYRTEAYYASGGWRATWKGEGGGVLLNQCLHNLDILQWLCGMPARLRGFCQLGRFHQIEVEDNATVYFEYDNGAQGTFITSTGEAPGTNRFEIAGTRGKIVLEQDKLTFIRNEICMREFSRTSKVGFLKPETWNIEIPITNAIHPHADLMQNFVNAIRTEEPLIAPGRDGLHSVELANAMLFSSLSEKMLELPMDGAAWEKQLTSLASESTFEKEVREVSTEDFTQSFHR